MLTSQQNVPRSFFMQISADIIEKTICHYISANIADNWQNKMYRPLLWGSATIIQQYCWHDHMFLWQFNMQISAAIIENSIFT